MRNLYIALAILFGASLHAQSEANLVKPESGGSYILNSGESEDLTATQSVILKPGAWIKSGATFRAYISDAPVVTDSPYEAPVIASGNTIQSTPVAIKEQYLMLHRLVQIMM